jgi:FkbM family methyltransferase
MQVLFSDIEAALRTIGKITVYVSGYPLVLDLRNPHERRYAACFVAHVQYPALDLDRYLIERFSNPGDRVLDAGANIGLTALLFVDAGASHVTAVEPLPELAERLRSIGCPKIACEQAALASDVGRATLFVSAMHNQGSTCDPALLSMFPHVYDQVPKTITVSTTTIDALAAPFDLWKLDIEGTEVDALAGAKSTLQNHPPRVIFAELYGDRFERFHAGIKNTHPHVYRAAISNDEYKLVLLDPSAHDERAGQFHPVPPTFVFLRTPA